MLLEFIGSPSSGKTTTAAKVFEFLKESDVVCEFLTEEARKYIVYKRRDNKLTYNSKIVLTDNDQLEILKRQLELELTYKKFCSPETVIIADSSPFNTLLYMSTGMRQSKEVQDLIALWKAEVKPMLFHSKSFGSVAVGDNNRVHDFQQCSAIDAKIPDLIQEHLTDIEVTPVFGSRKDRASMVSHAIISALAHGVL